MKRPHDSPKEILRTMTKARVDKYLANSGFNRPTTSPKPKLYAEEMKKGEWYSAIGEPIVFDVHGKLRNGANRLLAVQLLCEEDPTFTVEMRVVENASERFISKIDTNTKARSQKEKMEMVLGHAIDKVWHSAITGAVSTLCINNKEMLTPAELTKLYTNIKPYLKFAAKLSGKTFFGKSPFMAGILVAAMHDKNKKAVLRVVRTLAAGKTTKTEESSDFALALIELRNKSKNALAIQVTDGVETVPQVLTSKQLFNLAQAAVKHERDALSQTHTKPVITLELVSKKYYDMPEELKVRRAPLSDTFKKLTSHQIDLIIQSQSKRQYTSQEILNDSKK